VWDLGSQLEQAMTDQELRERIVVAPKVMVGQPCIRGSRLTVRLILGLLAHGATYPEIIAEYPRLTPDDSRACLLYAADMLTRPASINFDTDERFVTVSEAPRRRQHEATTGADDDG
jgi:uncharacterized protein (DUF433 family)